MTIETKEKPQFSIGQKVRVIVNDKNKTERLGTIRKQVWHYKDCAYNYYLEENGKKVYKRYYADDLEAVD